LILTALVVFCCTTLPAETSRTETTVPIVETKPATTVPAAAEKSTKPDAPTPKIFTASNEENALAVNADPGAPSIQPVLRSPIKPAATESYETRRQRMFWYGLVAAGHSTAAFDAWTTRRAVTSGAGVEANPMLRPFANSGAIYAATQVCPAVMDFVGRRMMRSRHPWMRQMWWLPQAASASVSLGAGLHNYSMVH
jgi:hypothetical protein